MWFLYWPKFLEPAKKGAVLIWLEVECSFSKSNTEHWKGQLAIITKKGQAMATTKGG